METLTDTQLYTFLKDGEVVDLALLEAAYQESVNSKKSLFSCLIANDVISDSNLGTIVADLHKMAYIRLSQIKIDKNALNLLPELVARKQQLIPFKQDKKGLHVATAKPGKTATIRFLTKKANQPLLLYYATPGEISEALNLYAQDVTKAFDEIINESVQKVGDGKQSDPSIIKIVDTIIKYAYQNHASDVHVEPLDEQTLVRFRIDGVLHDIVSLPLELNGQIVTRVKVMANLRTDEHHEPQDGKIIYQAENEELDIRLSVAPITKGEKIVMRLLSENSRQFSLADLGLANEDLAKVERAKQYPHGMILSTGPTGSGKTTSLYAILKLLNKRGVNIMTIEDPVEYDMDNVNQMQVNPKTELTFAKGLRSIVRQDPDIILVGEIRDEETASIAVNSAMTGHLVLSTFHTNDAATTFPRLVDMNVEPYLVGSTLRIIIAQRLVRKLCQSCRVSKKVDVSKLDAQVQAHLGDQKTLLIYEGKGCSVCHNTGYTGRIGIFEVIEMTDALADAIVDKQNAQQLQKIAESEGMTTMFADGIKKVQQGITSIEEVLRVTKE